MTQSCYQWIEFFKQNNCDQLPAHTGQNESDEPVWVLPFGKIAHFYKEYEAYQLANNLEDIASYETFRRTYDDHFKNTVRMVRCKGNFSHACGICKSGKAS